jgi:hypothetical protein
MQRRRWAHARAAGNGALLGVTCLAWLCSCSAKPTQPRVQVVPEPRPPSTSPYRYLPADWPEAWSHDGRTIAFRRVVVSRDGPPGIYLISAEGGSPRFLTPASFFFPRHLAFSPDDRLLVGAYGRGLATIDVGSGLTSVVVYSDLGFGYPQWSHSGRYIAYSIVSRFYSQPPESSGIHIHDTVIGADWPLRGTGGVSDGIYPQWTWDDSAIVYVDWQRRPEEVAALDLASGTRRTLLAGVDGVSTHLRDLQWWPASARGGAELLIAVRRTWSPTRWLVFGFRDTTTHPFPYAPGDDPELRVSLDGRRVAYRAFDARDSVVVLFVRDLAAGPPGGRQLTFCAPPDSLLPFPLKAGSARDSSPLLRHVRPVLRVERVAQSVAQEVEAQQRERERDPGKHHEPRK